MSGPVQASKSSPYVRESDGVVLSRKIFETLRTSDYLQLIRLPQEGHFGAEEKDMGAVYLNKDGQPVALALYPLRLHPHLYLLADGTDAVVEKSLLVFQDTVAVRGNRLPVYGKAIQYTAEQVERCVEETVVDGKKCVFLTMDENPCNKVEALRFVEEECIPSVFWAQMCARKAKGSLCEAMKHLRRAACALEERREAPFRMWDQEYSALHARQAAEDMGLKVEELRDMWIANSMKEALRFKFQHDMEFLTPQVVQRCYAMCWKEEEELLKGGKLEEEGNKAEEVVEDEPKESKEEKVVADEPKESKEETDVEMADSTKGECKEQDKDLADGAEEEKKRKQEEVEEGCEEPAKRQRNDDEAGKTEDEGGDTLPYDG